MGFRCGIVGLPNVGKSTLFNALTKAGIEAANYPFCTIEPNVGMVPVPDVRLPQIAEIAASKETIPALMQFVDIAGLVAGASKGEGLGNQFLAHIREVQAIAHVVRCFEDDDVTHVAGSVDPVRDVEVIHLELTLADLDSIERALVKNQKDLKRGEKTAAARKATLEKAKALLDAGQLLQSGDWDDAEQAVLKPLQLLTNKPIFYVANVDEGQAVSGNTYVDALKAYADKTQSPVVVICAAIEAEIATLAAEEQSEFLESLGLQEPGLHRLIQAGFSLLGLETYFTAGPKESRAWTFPRGALAPQAAGVIHTDFEKGFIRAEIIGYEDYIACQGEAGAKEAGKWRLEGKDYVVQDGDVIHFRFNV